MILNMYVSSRNRINQQRDVTYSPRSSRQDFTYVKDFKNTVAKELARHRTHDSKRMYDNNVLPW